MIDKTKLKDIIDKLSAGTPLTTDDKDVLLSVLVERLSKPNAVNNDDFNIFDTKELKKYQDDLEKIEHEIEEIKKKAVDGKLTKKQQESLNNWIIKAENIRTRMNEIQRINNKVLELSIDINKEYEKQDRALDKQLEIRNLETKSIREGLTWEERRYKILTQIGERVGFNTDMLRKGFQEIKKGLTDAKDVISKFNEPWAAADQSASKYVRTIGGSAASMEKLRKTTIDFMNARSIGIKYNTSMEELIKLQGDYNANIGRSIDLTNDQKETFAAMKSVIGEQAAMDFSVKLENFGLNPDEVGNRVGEMFSKASKSGIAFEKYSKNFLNNIKLAQNYNFQNGLKGLESMARKATAIKLDMQQVAAFAEKVSTLEGAVQAGAQLSVLGGSFSQMGNPLSMLYEGLNDMEGLQDRMVKMFGNLGKWDYSKGQVDVSVYNKQRIKAAAQATGMDYSAVMEMINANARRNIVEGKLGSQYDNDKDFKELLLNKSQVDEKGNAFVTINGERKDINKLSTTDENYLKANNNSDSDNIAEIAVNTRGYADIKEGLKKQGDAATASLNEFTGIGKITKEGMAWLGERSGLLKAIKAVNPLLGITNALLTTINGAVLAIAAKMMFGGGSVGGKFGSVNKTIGKPSSNITRVNGKTIRTLKDGTQQMWSGGSVGGSGSGWKKMTLGQRMKYGNLSPKGMSTAAKMGAGLGLGVAGLAGDFAINHFGLEGNKGNNIGGYTAAKAGTGALKGAAMGAMFGLPGMIIGGIAGAAIGGGMAYVDAKKENLANTLRSRGAMINDSSAYTIKELENMQYGNRALEGNLKQKMVANGDALGFASGGYTGDGNPLEPAGTVHKGEIVIPSAAVKASGNLMNSITVSSNKQAENKVNTSVPSEIKISPIEIKLSGNLTVNGDKVDTQKLMDAITPKIIDQINEQLMARNDFRIDRNKIHKKFAY